MCLFIISLNLFQIIIVSVWKSFCLFVYFFELYFVWLFPLWALYYLFLVFNVYFLNKRIKSVWSVFFFIETSGQIHLVLATTLHMDQRTLPLDCGRLMPYTLVRWVMFSFLSGQLIKFICSKGLMELWIQFVSSVLCKLLVAL